MRKMKKEIKHWEGVPRMPSGRKKLAREPDARRAMSEQIEHLLPAYLKIGEVTIKAHPRYAGRGRPKKGQQPVGTNWRIEGKLTVVEARARREWRRQKSTGCPIETAEDGLTPAQQQETTGPGGLQAARRRLHAFGRNVHVLWPWPWDG